MPQRALDNVPLPSLGAAALALVTAFVAGSSSCAPAEREAFAATGPRGTQVLLVKRGEVRRSLVMTGEIDAVEAIELKVPRTPTGRGSLSFLLPEGAEVKAGDVVAELDGASFAAQIRERTLSVSQAEMDLARQGSENGVKEADAAMEVERRRAVMRRAEIDADVPPGILPKRDFLEKQLALRRATVDFDRATAALVTQRQAADVDVSLKRIALEKVKRALGDATAAMKALTLRAPAAGTVVLGEHSEERRKLQETDDVLMGWTVARVASSQARSIRAWLSDVDDGRIAVGMPATVVIDAHPEHAFAGKVREISAVARQPRERTQRRMFQVDVDLDEQDASLLRPGLSARVDVLCDVQAGLVAPRAALQFDGPRPRVYLEGGGSLEVALGPCSASACLVTGGVAEGTRVRRAP